MLGAGKKGNNLVAVLKSSRQLKFVATVDKILPSAEGVPLSLTIDVAAAVCLHTKNTCKVSTVNRPWIFTHVYRKHVNLLQSFFRGHGGRNTSETTT